MAWTGINKRVVAQDEVPGAVYMKAWQACPS
jgi:hypothetical protein